jgi:signal transduction histidine kinase
VVNRDVGTGIGLSIARRIVESRHGRIWIENLPEGGAMLVFELPDGVDDAE